MIKGEVEEITLKMDSEEVKALLKQFNNMEILNIMGKRYLMQNIDCNEYARFTYLGYRKTKVTIRVIAIKKGN